MTANEPTPVPEAEVANGWYYERQGKRIGPVSSGVVTKEFKDGHISLDTLVWNRSFGTEWQALKTTDLLPRGDEPPPLPTTHVNSTFAWILAILPLLGAIIEKIARDSNGTTLSTGQSFVAYGIANGIVALIDASNIEKSGRNSKHIHLWIWAILVVPIYLLQRGRALGRSFSPLLVWIGCFLSGVAISTPEIFTGNVYWGTGIPSCSSSFVSDELKKIFKDIPLIRVADLQAVDVRDQSETAVSDTTRSCHSNILASNSKEYSINYTIEQRGNQYYIKMNLQP